MTNMASSGLVTPGAEMRGEGVGDHVAGLRGEHAGRFGIARISAAAGEHHHQPDEQQAEDDGLGHVAFGFVDLLGDRAGRLESEERPADEGDGEQHRARRPRRSRPGMPALENSAENGFSR